ncbi:MAG: DUF4349 domain-containing protein [Spirochaetaceae bacterium]|nr:DUF4349 domain-containing protein [Spirochaetaceae bacterium]
MKKNNTFCSVLVTNFFIFLTICFLGCGGSKDSAIQLSKPESAVKMRSMGTATNSKMAYADSVVLEEAVEMEFDAAVAGGANASYPSPVPQQERKLIKTGSINLEVENLSETEKAVQTWCQHFGGYIASSYNQENHSSFTVRIPASNFDDAMNTIGDFGKIKYRSISTEDVSEQFYDLQTRLETRKILRDRLQSYLSTAKDMKDMLQIESELNDTLSEIESMEGRMRRLSGQIDYSTINVTIELPYRTTDQGFQWPQFGNGFRRFLSNIVDFFVGFFTVLLYIVICGIPIIAAIAFFYWLLLGKVGILKKLFSKLSKKKEQEK